MGINILQYKFKNSNFGAINSLIELDSSFNINQVSNSISVWRNIRQFSTNTVRNVSNGWKLEGQLYSCYFEVKNPNGLLLDFGDRECVIDGSKISGTKLISEGIHKFSTVADNWLDIVKNIRHTILWPN